MDNTALATLVVFVSLLIFVGVLVYYGIPGKLAAALDQRSARIEAELAEAARFRQEAADLLAEYQRRASEAEREAAAIVAEARAEADRLAAETTRALEDSIVRRTRAAEAKIAQAETQAVAEVRARAVDIAVAAARDIMQNRLAGDAGERLMANAIADVRNRLN